MTSLPGRERNVNATLGQQLNENGAIVTQYIEDIATRLELLKNRQRDYSTNMQHKLEIEISKERIDDLHEEYSMAL